MVRRTRQQRMFARIVDYYSRVLPGKKISDFLKSTNAYLITSFLYYCAERVHLIFFCGMSQVEIIKERGQPGRGRILLDYKVITEDGFEEFGEESIRYTEPTDLYPFIYFLLVKTPRPRVLFSYKIGKEEEVGRRYFNPSEDVTQSLLKDIRSSSVYPMPHIPFKIMGMSPSNPITDFFLHL